MLGLKFSIFIRFWIPDQVRDDSAVIFYTSSKTASATGLFSVQPLDELMI